MVFIDDLLTPEELSAYVKTSYPFNLSILHSALLKKLKTEPDYEVWVPLIHYPLTQLKRSNKWPEVITPHQVFISNKGRVCTLRKDGVKFARIHRLKNGYVVFGLSIDKRTRSIVMHRALACSFLSLDRFMLVNGDVFVAHPKDLQVNHIDGVKWNFSLPNLEWVTQSGNTAHAIELGLIPTGENSKFTKCVKGVVEFGPFKGHEFVLHGPSDFKLHGFTQPNVVACCKGRLNSHKNCKWFYASKEEVKNLPNGISLEIKKSLAGVSRRVKIFG